MTEYNTVTARVEYVVEVSVWDHQNQCSDGKYKYDIFPTQEAAENWFIEKKYERIGNYWHRPNDTRLTGKVVRRIVELDEDGFNV